MEQIPSPGPSKLFHLRMIASLAFFLFWDGLSTYICLSSLILDKDAIKRGTALGGLGGSSILFAAEVSELQSSDASHSRGPDTNGYVPWVVSLPSL